MEFAGDLLGDTLDAAMGFEVDFLGGILDGGVTGMYSGKFDMFTDGIEDDFALLSDGVKLNLFGLFDELGDHHRVLLADVGGQTKETLEFFGVGADVHCGAAKDVTGADENGESNLVDKGIDVFQGGEFFPAGLVDMDTVEET